MENRNPTQPSPPRAHRFDIQLPLRYRASGETAWHEGRTQNISYTGVLFWVDGLMEAHTPVEISFDMPVEVGGERGAAVICQGEIVRTVLPATTDAQPALAARILQYQFVRGGKRARLDVLPLHLV